MKIAIDIRALQDKRHSGVQEYLLSLLKELLRFDHKNSYCLFSSGRKRFSNKAIQNLVAQYSNLQIKHLYIANKLLALCWYFSNWPNLDKFLGYPDIFFAPNLNILPKHILSKTIVTFHDLSFERFPEFFSWKSKLWHWVIRPRLLAQKARAILTVSDSTKQDLKELYGISSSKIKVIPLGKDKSLKMLKGTNKALKAVKKKYNLPDRFILYLGTIEPRKNIIGIIRAYALLRKTGKFCGYQLVLVGPKGWLFKKIFREAKKSSYNKNIFFIGPVQQEERLYLYNLASLFVYPSFFEGFGLPPLEAMTCGVPVIASNRSSLSSVVGEAAIMVDPYRVGEITWAIEEILKDRQLYKELRKRGLVRVKKFSWENTAKGTLKLFRKTQGYKI